MRFTTALIATCLVATLVSDANAQCEVRRTALDLAPGDQFGRSLGSDDNFVIVGSTHDDDAGSLSGAAYSFELTGGVWSQVQKLVPFDLAAGDKFGRSVSLDDGTLMVGSYLDDDTGVDSGSVYVYERAAGQWLQAFKLTGSQTGDGDQFGYSLCIRGDLAVISAREDMPFGQASGSVYVFERILGQWQEVAYLAASDGGVADYFGESVAIDGEYVLVGAYGEDDGGTGSGAVYIFKVNSSGVWVETQKIEPADDASLDFFGWSMSAQNGRAVIGAWGKTTAAGSLAGAAYVFERSAGQYLEVAKLLPSQQSSLDSFGYSVALCDDRILVGAVDSNNQGLNSGAGYRYRYDGVEWIEEAVSDYGALSPGHRLGFTAAMTKDLTILATMPADGLGAVWIERGPFTDCNGNGIPDGCDVDSGVSLDLDGDRVPDECSGVSVFCLCDAAAPCGNVDPAAGCVNSTGFGARLLPLSGNNSVMLDGLVLRADRLPPTTYALFFMGPAERSPVPLGGGLRCVDAPLYRFNLGITNSAGEVHLGPGLAAFAQGQFPAIGQITAGSTWRFQGWYRDAFGSCTTSNVTSAVAVTFAP